MFVNSVIRYSAYSCNVTPIRLSSINVQSNGSRMDIVPRLIHSNVAVVHSWNLLSKPGLAGLLQLGMVGLVTGGNSWSYKTSSQLASTNKPTLNFLQALPVPNQQCQSTQGKFFSYN